MFSSSKVITAIAVASLADQGVLKYGDPVANYIPEFASKPAVRKVYNFDEKRITSITKNSLLDDAIIIIRLYQYSNQ